jgi:hypothetical protein
MAKQETKHLQRALVQGRGAYLRTLAIVHRAGSTRTQREIERIIVQCDVSDEFLRTPSGALIHASEQ